MSQAENAVVAWLKACVLPFTTLSPFALLDDLIPLQQIIGAATLVGPGEGSHGARECF